MTDNAQRRTMAAAVNNVVDGARCRSVRLCFNSSTIRLFVYNYTKRFRADFLVISSVRIKNLPSPGTILCYDYSTDIAAYTICPAVGSPSFISRAAARLIITLCLSRTIVLCHYIINHITIRVTFYLLC